MSKFCKRLKPNIVAAGVGRARICARYFNATNGFSNKIQNLECAVALHFMYNFGRTHKSLCVTPAMKAGISDHVWSLEEIAKLAD